MPSILSMEICFHARYLKLSQDDIKYLFATRLQNTILIKVLTWPSKAVDHRLGATGSHGHRFLSSFKCVAHHAIGVLGPIVIVVHLAQRGGYHGQTGHLVDEILAGHVHYHGRGG